jgi:hypothetical protein
MRAGKGGRRAGKGGRSRIAISSFPRSCFGVLSPTLRVVFRIGLADRKRTWSVQEGIPGEDRGNELGRYLRPSIIRSFISITRYHTIFLLSTSSLTTDNRPLPEGCP